MIRYADSPTSKIQGLKVGFAPLIQLYMCVWVPRAPSVVSALYPYAFRGFSVIRRFLKGQLLYLRRLTEV